MQPTAGSAGFKWDVSRRQRLMRGLDDMEEKHGAFWSGPHGGWQTAYERYDPATDQIAVVLVKNDLFKAVVFCKRSDPQWRLPLWVERTGESLLGIEAEAIAYVEGEISRSGSA